MRLVADRFAIIDDQQALDLATGARVVLQVTSGGILSEQTRWALRCDALQKLQHRRLAPLVDYGALGTAQRFEAWRCGPRWNGEEAEAERARRVACLFLRGCGLTAGSESLEAVRSSSRGAIVLPDEGSGYPEAEGREIERHADHTSLETCGLAMLDRRALPVLVELLQFTSEARPRVIALLGPPGSGKTQLFREVARCARLNGFVPVAAHLASLVRGLGDRSVCLIDDESRGGPWAPLIDLEVKSPRPHVVIVGSGDDVPSAAGIRLDALSPDALVSAFRPQPIAPGLLARIRRAATESQGRPGRFVERLWKGIAEGGVRRPIRRLPRVAEQSAVYGMEDEPDPAGPEPAAGVRRWPSTRELTSLRCRMDDAIGLIESGRHMPGVRKLRQAVAGLARRDDWEHAAGGTIALGSFLLRRGQVQHARAVLEEAKGYCARAGRDAAALDVATLAGEAWIDLARLDEAEAVIAAVLAAARAAGDRARVAAASLALGRVLFWRGSYADAEVAIATSDDDSLPFETANRTTRLAARVAVGRRDFTRAMARANDALERARAADDRRAQAAAHCAAAFVHLAVGDLDAVDRDVAASVATARAAHDPLRAVRARLLLAEAERRRDRRFAAGTTVDRLRALGAARLPPLLGARCDLLHELLRSAAPPPEVAARTIAATGLGALALFLPDGAAATPAPALDFLTDELVDILSICQEAQDESAALADVCSRVRRQLHAASVAYLVSEQATQSVLVSSGPHVDTAIAARVVSAGISIAPHRHGDRVEAAAAVRHGGSIIGVLAARWTLGSPHDLSRAAAILTMAATATAPIVAAAVARRSRPRAPALDGLLGVTSAMVDLRSAVERAAAAPFPVLVEGESGAGKELVARAVHRSGPRRDRSFCTVNCAALPDDLIEAELFGHARGAFTGAIADRAGVFEEAHGGTLFLDEIGELSARAQAKVLRVVQEGELRRVGENVTRRVDVRIVAATNRDLRQEASSGRFRADLLYRLDVVRIPVPPLRERRDDIALLVDHFWNEAAGRVGSRATLSPATVAALSRYDWPGNVRELQNVLAALAVRCPKRGLVSPNALPPAVVGHPVAESCQLDEARRTFEQRFVRAALVRTGGHRGRAATELGVTRQGLTKLMARLGISEPRPQTHD